MVEKAILIALLALGALTVVEAVSIAHPIVLAAEALQSDSCRTLMQNGC